MSDNSRENVPRGDHVPGGPNDASAAEMNQKAERAEPGVDSAPHRGHGAHGKGVGGREEHDDEPNPTPPFAKGTAAATPGGTARGPGDRWWIRGARSRAGTSWWRVGGGEW